MIGTALLKLPIAGRRTSQFRYRFAPTSRGIFSVNVCDGDQHNSVDSEASGSPGSSQSGDRSMEQIREGKAFMSQPKGDAVFYSKVQVFNRDLSILVVRLFQEVREKELLAKYVSRKERYIADPQQFKSEPSPPIPGIRVLDALSASGLRSVRYLKEINGIRSVTINDLMPDATDTAKEVCRENSVDLSKVVFHTGDANDLMFRHRVTKDRFDVIDIDPFGSASKFLDTAVQAIADGGLLCVTCTDLAVLSGASPEKCQAKYGSLPLKSSYYREMALRIVLLAIDTAGNRHGKHIEPWLSISADFYVRVFVRVHESQSGASRSALNRMMVFHSTKCPSFHLQPLAEVRQSPKTNGDVYGGAIVSAPSVCEETGSPLRMGGPYWSGVLHEQWVVERILENLRADRNTPAELPTAVRLEGVLMTVRDELKDVPFYYVLPELFSSLHSEQSSMLKITSAIKNAGYVSSRFHNEANAIKTNAPNFVVWDIMRAYCRLNPPKGSAHKAPSEVAQAILANPSRTKVNFKLDYSLNIPQGRFLPNPEAHWGPGRKGKEKSASQPRPKLVENSNAESIIAVKKEDSSSSPYENEILLQECSEGGDPVARQRREIKDANAGGIICGIERKGFEKEHSAK